MTLRDKNPVTVTSVTVTAVTASPQLRATFLVTVTAVTSISNPVTVTHPPYVVGGVTRVGQ